MANYITCAKQGFSFESILMSMFSQYLYREAASEILGFRIAPQEGDFEYLPECDRYEDWQMLFREALEISDGVAWLRVVAAEPENHVPTCTNWQTVGNLARQSFVRMTATGEVAFVLIVPYGSEFNYSPQL